MVWPPKATSTPRTSFVPFEPEVDWFTFLAAIPSALVRLEDGPPWALEMQALLGPLIQALTDETSLLRVGQKGNGAPAHIIQ
jgi:hypothetical protein